MGSIVYDGAEIHEAADSQIAHIDAVTQHLFRRGVGFMMITASDNDTKARSVWMTPQVSVQFLYEDYETIEIDKKSFPRLVEAVMRAQKFVLCNPNRMPFRIGGAETAEGVECAQ